MSADVLLSWKIDILCRLSGAKSVIVEDRISQANEVIHEAVLFGLKARVPVTTNN